MNPLDNPIWEALTTSQAGLAEISGAARRFPPDFTILGGFLDPSREAYDSLCSMQTDRKSTALFLKSHYDPPAGWTVVQELRVLQMMLSDSQTPKPAAEWIELAETDSPEMLFLAQLTKPGPFGNRTHELGTYIGNRHEGKLVAMAGERLRFRGYTEISAVCTHPDFLGRGLAAGLIGVLAHKIRSRDETPFLHVRGDNTRAIELYKRLGFEERFSFHCSVVRSPAKQR